MRRQFNIHLCSEKGAFEGWRAEASSCNSSEVKPCLTLRVMTYICAPHPEDYVFSDVCGVICNSLQIARDDQRIEGVAMDFYTMCHCEIRSFKDLPIHVVHQIVSFENRLRHVGIG